MTLEEIKDQVAYEYEWIDWICFLSDCHDHEKDVVIDEVAERYAQSQTQYLIKSLDAKQGQIDKLIKKYDRREIDFKSQTQELQEQNSELVEMLEKSLGALNDCCMVIDSEDEVFEYIKNLSVDITKVLFNYRTKINVK